MSSTATHICHHSVLQHWACNNTNAELRYDIDKHEIGWLTSTSCFWQSCPTSALNWSTAVCSRIFSDMSWSCRCRSNSICRWCSSSRRASCITTNAAIDWSTMTLYHTLKITETVKNITFWKCNNCVKAESRGNIVSGLCSYSVQVQRMCSIVNTHSQCSHVEAAS